jgi:membrane associated rhomboid family serine protease
MASYCYRHTNRETGVSCSNCGRPICPECMTPTSVGMRCPECATQKTQIRRPTGPSFSGFATWSGGSRWTVTNVLIAINVLVFLAEVGTGVSIGGSDPHGWVFNHGSLVGLTLTGHNPYQGPPGYVGNHQYWRLLTSGFLHEGLIHIAFNMLSLWMIGRTLEPAIGRTNFAAIYFSSLLAGSFGALVFTPDVATAGASGAVFGVFGAFAAVAYSRGISLVSTGILPILLFNLIFDLTVSGISIGGHIGGFVAGVLGGFAVVELAERRRKPAWALVVCLVIACVSVVGALLVAGGTGIAPNGLTI